MKPPSSAEEAALTAELIDATRDLFAYRAGQPPQPVKLLRFSEITPNMPPADPGDRRRKDRIHVIGKRLHAIGGTAAMHRALERASQTLGSGAIAPIDHAWEGIGNEWWP